MKTQPAWTEAEEEDVIRRWNGGASGSEIGNLYGLSRNAVIGRLHRLRNRDGLEVRSAGGEHRLSSIPKKPANRNTNTTRPQSWGVREMQTSFPGKRREDRVDAFTKTGLSQVEKFEARMTNKGIPLLEIRAYQCRFPTSASWPYLMCGEPVERGSYCPSCSDRVSGRAA